MKKCVLLYLISLYHVTCGSVISVNEQKDIANAMKTGWEAQDMPDPRYAPELCGISKSGWFCDPDGVFRNASIGGGPTAADALNMELWVAANESHCPCPNRRCYVHNAIILVAVVEKLKNSRGLSQRRLLKSFAKELQEHHWKADDSECQQEIIIVLSLEDHAIVTEVGDDILKSGMMTYEDVELVGGVSQNIFASHSLYSHINFIIQTYKRYLDHPLSSIPTDSYHERQTTLTSSTSPSIFANSSSAEVSKVGVQETPKSFGLPSSVIVVIVLAVLVFLTIVTLILTIPFCRKGDSNCLRRH